MNCMHGEPAGTANLQAPSERAKISARRSFAGTLDTQQLPLPSMRRQSESKQNAIPRHSGRPTTDKGGGLAN